MQTPLQLTFRSMPHSDSIAAHIHARAEKLERLCDRVVSCHVVVGLAGHHHRNGDRFHVSINLGLPGHELVVTHDAADGMIHGQAIIHAIIRARVRQPGKP